MRQKNESPVDYGSTIRHLGGESIPRKMATEALEEYLVDQNLIGPSPFDLRKHVQLQHPKNLDQAVNLVLSTLPLVTLIKS